MAIAFDSVTSGASSTWTSRTFSHTCTGSNLMLFVDCMGNAWDTITGVTYNGVSMTLVSKLKQWAQNIYWYTFALFNPSPWANNVVVTSSVSTSIYATSTSYTWVSQTTTFDAVATSSISGSSWNLSTTLSTTVANCWVRCYSANDTALWNAYSDIMRGTNNGANSFDTNWGIVSPWSKTMTQNATWTNISSYSIMISFAPFIPVSSQAWILYLFCNQ